MIVPVHSFGDSFGNLDRYESHWAAKVGFHWWVTTKVQRLGLLAMGGSSFGLNQWCGYKRNMGEQNKKGHTQNKRHRRFKGRESTTAQPRKADAQLACNTPTRCLFTSLDAFATSSLLT